MYYAYRFLYSAALLIHRHIDIHISEQMYVLLLMNKFVIFLLIYFITMSWWLYIFPAIYFVDIS